MPVLAIVYLNIFHSSFYRWKVMYRALYERSCEFKLWWSALNNYLGKVSLIEFINTSNIMPKHYIFAEFSLIEE